MAAAISAINEVNKVNVLTDRVKRREQEWKDAKLHICGTRAKSFTEGWKAAEAEPNNIRWAIALARVLDESPIIIREGEIVVGVETRHIRGAEVSPEHNPHDLLTGLEQRHLVTMSEVMVAEMEPADESIIKETAQYWMGKSIRDFVHAAYRRQVGEKYAELQGGGVRVFTDTVGVTGKVQAVFNPSILKEGFNGRIARAKAEKEKVKESLRNFPKDVAAAYHKIAVLDSIIIAGEAIIRFAMKHAELARKMAQIETNPARKAELEQMAEACDWVPANPPRSFLEALQFYWFCHIGYRKEGPFPSGACPGRMDQWLFPYYEKDLKEGKLTRQQAAEILALMWIKFDELQSFHGNFFSKEAAGSMLQQITIAGTDKDGRDATNELSFLLLEVSRQLKTPQPGFYVRWHASIDHNFMIKCVETNRDTGGGIPAFLNDQAAIRNFLGIGVEWEDAVEWSAAGCLSYSLGHCNSVVRMPLYVNVPKILELALNNGIDPRTGIKAGLPTGDAAQFKNFEEVEEAFWQQYAFFVDISFKKYFAGHLAKAERLAAPFASAITEDSIKSGKDYLEEGGRYPQLNLCFGQRGCVDVANALAAMKKVVFDDKKVSMSKLLDALKANWVGYEDVLQLCMQAPKYGNDDDSVDEIFNRVSLKSNEIVLNQRDPNGVRWKVGRPALTGHYYFGEVVGALPNGRKAGTPLYDAALSPGAGTDVNGPTAAIRSATKVNHFKPDMDSLVMNMKLSASVLKDRAAIENMIALVRTFFNRGGWHIQFNILNRDDLIQAKKHPEEWRHLIVRVAGYSAYFVELPEGVQDEIIARTEHGL